MPKRTSRIGELPPAQNTTTIDNLDQALALVDKMKAHLPITVRAEKPLLQSFQARGEDLSRNQLLQIQDVLYMGDEGGIVCDITRSGESTEVVLCSLTHLAIIGHTPLEREMRSYQRKRSAKLARQQSDSPYRFTIKPRAGKR